MFEKPLRNAPQLFRKVRVDRELGRWLAERADLDPTPSTATCPRRLPQLQSRLESRVHRGCTRTQNVAIRGYQRDAQTLWLREKRHNRPPPHFNGKEGVDGSSPSEGFAPCTVSRTGWHRVREGVRELPGVQRLFAGDSRE